MTRWYLRRHPLHGVMLVVELREPERRGFAHYVTSRAHARKTLAALRPMVEAIAARDAKRQEFAVSVFDAAEVDDAA